jgi:hypothetical protein
MGRSTDICAFLLDILDFVLRTAGPIYDILQSPQQIWLDHGVISSSYKRNIDSPKAWKSELPKCIKEIRKREWISEL